MIDAVLMLPDCFKNFFFFRKENNLNLESSDKMIKNTKNRYVFVTRTREKEKKYEKYNKQLTDVKINLYV